MKHVANKEEYLEPLSILVPFDKVWWVSGSWLGESLWDSHSKNSIFQYLPLKYLPPIPDLLPLTAEELKLICFAQVGAKSEASQNLQLLQLIPRTKVTALYLEGKLNTIANISISCPPLTILNWPTLLPNTNRYSRWWKSWRVTSISNQVPNCSYWFPFCCNQGNKEPPQYLCQRFLDSSKQMVPLVHLLY